MPNIDLSPRAVTFNQSCEFIRMDVGASRHPILAKGFTPAQCEAAALVTGLCVRRDGKLMLREAFTHPDRLRQAIESIADYFENGQAGPQLLAARQQLADYGCEPMGDFETAWADYRLREELADEARGCKDPWGNESPHILSWREVNKIQERILNQAARAGEVSAT